MLAKTIASKSLLLKTIHHVTKQSTRNSGHGVWSYRAPPPMPSKKTLMIANVIGGLAWGWVFYHILDEPGHVIGEWKYMDLSSLTDEELGIPPDSAGSLKGLSE